MSLADTKILRASRLIVNVSNGFHSGIKALSVQGYLKSKC